MSSSKTRIPPPSRYLAQRLWLQLFQAAYKEEGGSGRDEEAVSRDTNLDEGVTIQEVLFDD
jgi:hypothetical protein